MAIKPPYKLYNSQKQYITDALNWLNNDHKFTFIEGPTGMGKTICNLMVATKYVRNEGKVIYFTREHTQIDQCLGDMNRLLDKNPDIDNIRALHISGLSKACLRKEVLVLTDEEEQTITCEEFHDNLCDYSSIIQKDEQINLSRHQILTLLPEHKDLYHNFNISVGDTISNTMSSIEHMQVSEVQDLVDEIYDVSLVSNERIMEIAEKYTICPRKLQNLALDSANIIFAPYNYLVIPRIKIQENQEYMFIIDEAHNLDQNLTDMQSFVITKRSILSFIRAVQRDHGNNEEFQLDVGTVMPLFLNLIDTPQDIVDEALIGFLKGIPKDPYERIGSIINMTVRRNIRRRSIYERSSSSATDERRNRVPKSFMTMQKFFQAIDRLLVTKSGIIKINDDKFMIKFNDADYIFNSVTTPASKVMVSSGTLFPDHMRFYLGMTKDNSEAHSYTPPHVNLVGSGKIVSTINGNELTTTYNKRSMEVIQSYAKLIREVHSRSEGGTLIFFTSYKFRDLLMDMLPDMDLYQPHEVDEFRKEVSEGKKAIFMSAFRGKGSEGWNFPDDQSRTILMIGVPFLPMDVTVKSQMKYYNSKRAGLGETWYKQKAVLWLVQAFGRGFRHKDDYSKVYFADKRVGSLRRYFPKWVYSAINWTPGSWERYGRN